MQNLIFSHFTSQLDEEIRIAKENDKYDEGVVDIRVAVPLPQLSRRRAEQCREASASRE